MLQTTAVLDQIKADLRAQKDPAGTVKPDIYSHLNEVLNRIIQYHPYDALERFEDISTLVKQSNYSVKDPQHDHEVNGNAAEQSRITNRKAIAYIDQAKQLLAEEPGAGVSKEDRKLLTTDKQFCIPNLQEQSQMLEWAGVQFGDDNLYLLQKSLKRLAVSSGASTLSLFGKIYGRKCDYWVAQGILDYDEEASSNSLQEKRNEGVNSGVYWVTDNLLNDWIQLPEATPEHIQVASVIKYQFTGNLNAEIDSCPPFPGKERHLLRATLARITHATEICPKGLYEVDEETQEVKPAEEFALPGCEELKSLEAWGHRHQNILKVGRCSHTAPVGIPEDQQEDFLAKQAEEDKVEERFRALNEDVPVKGHDSAWLSRVCGDTQAYNAGGESTLSYATNVIKSLRWPGAVTVSRCGEFCSIYVGDGIKGQGHSYDPVDTPEVQSDPVDQQEMPEPTPLTSPRAPLEPETEAQEGEEEEAE